MNKLIKFNETKVVDGFEFDEGWWGEFSPTGELVTVYAYPIVDVDYYDWTYDWYMCKIFYRFDGGFIGGLKEAYKLPEEVIEDFEEVAEQEMLDKKEKFLEYYGE